MSGPVLAAALQCRSAAQFTAWGLLFDLAVDVPEGWSIIGGQMVALLAAEHSAALPRVTEDMDVIANVRATPRLTTTIATWLTGRGVELEGISPEGIGHRYVRDLSGPRRVIFDVLAPEGLGERTVLTTTPPARTLEVPGGTQLLDRSELVEVTAVDIDTVTSRTGSIRRPSLLAAIIGKAEATRIAVRTNRERDWTDAALLLSLVPDPVALRPQLQRKDRERLGLLRPLLEEDHRALRILQPQQAQDARLVLAALLADSLPAPA